MVKTNKNKDDELVTRGILKVELKTELKKALEPYVTKKYLGEALDGALAKERQRNIAFFASKQDLQEGLDNLENRLSVKLDKVARGTEKLLSKWDTKEQEDAMHRHQHKLAEDRLANHDKRLEKLEKVAGSVL
jgi:hypothetical protein